MKLVALAVFLIIGEVFAASCSATSENGNTFGGSNKDYVCNVCTNSEETDCTYKCFNGVRFTAVALGGPLGIAKIGEASGATRAEAEENARELCRGISNCFVENAQPARNNNYRPTIGKCSN